ASNSEPHQCYDSLGKSHNMNVSHIVEKFKKLWSVREWIERGYFTEEYICNINAHWLSFESPSRSSFVILAVIYLNIMLTGFVGNFLVIFLYVRQVFCHCKCKNLRTPGNILTANLAVSDMIITLETPIFIYNCFHMGPALGDIGGLSGTVSIITLSAISFDRYFMIKFPLNRAYSKLRVKICLAIVWLYGLTFSSIPALNIGLGRYTYEGYLTSCSFDYLTEDAKERMFVFAFFIAAYVVPLLLITFCYVNIIKVVTDRSIANNESKDSFRHVKEEASKRQEVKLAVVVLYSILLWFIAWTPYSAVALLGIFDQKHLISPLSSMIPAVFCKIASCINPFVYSLTHPKFKSELKKMLCVPTKTDNRHRSHVWSIHSSKNKNNLETYHESSDVEEEIVMIESSSKLESGSKQIFENPVSPGTAESKFRREPSIMEMFCLRPNFSNKSTTFRRMSRRWSIKEKEMKTKERYGIEY
ncbi:hypothetical protein NQ315_010577, partial [Exocentrus adspersus]